jgi:diguanylate cyclase (GGDEF)-like protein
MKTDGGHLNSAILISSIFLYMFRRSIDTNRDVLTKLLNRMSFYEDCRRFNPSISAIGSADMNGLKIINDSIGYEAGDAALREIGKCLDEISSRNVYAYRTGGDEFALLFIRLPENKVHETMERVKGLVRNRGYSISTGYAMRGGTYMPVQELIRHADEDMYANKAKYYSEVIHDRRKNRPRQPEAKREEPHEDRADF